MPRPRLRSFGAALTACAAVAVAVHLSAPPGHADDGVEEPAPASVVLAATRDRVGHGSTVVLRARVADTAGQGVPDYPVALQVRSPDADAWRPGGTARTDAAGRVELERTPGTTRRYRVVTTPSGLEPVARSDSVRVVVVPHLRARWTRIAVRPGATASLRGVVRPVVEGERVQLQRRSGGRWKDVASARPTAQGRYSFVVSHERRGSYSYRVTLPGSASHARATTPRLRLLVARIVTYRIESRGRLTASRKVFARQVAETLRDPQGWSRGYLHFRRVRHGGDVSVVLTRAERMPGFGAICDTYWSCRVGRYVVINENRWRFGTPLFLGSGASLRDYRHMVVNHEMGHWLGRGHAGCPGRGRPAPVMMQQSMGLHGCEPNPWPLRWEVKHVR